MASPAAKRGVIRVNDYIPTPRKSPPPEKKPRKHSLTKHREALGPLQFERTVRFFRGMCRERSPRILRSLMRIVESEDLYKENPLAVVAAGRVILEYGYGKPEALAPDDGTATTSQVVVHMTADQLRQSLMEDVGPKLIEAVGNGSRSE